MAESKSKAKNKAKIPANAVELAVGDKVDVAKGTSVPNGFKGTVEKIYTNSAMLTIDDFDTEDSVVVEDLKHKTVINFANIKLGGKPVKAPVTEEDEAKNKNKNARKSGAVKTIKPASDTKDTKDAKDTEKK
ncbi:hypothetical protein [Lacticaseibacillus thailandensis]|uniref:Uncharacterized protein n=1 Tax=Lacticaseibacillus thailandensis DSM 22698 = JCM 13996 TaxID=1423810 RepID=A0A0R2C704_9LACO|nr:hypothetical protein [Lacticaseibacillus thailandensis]KRM86997.1 hypothetical protein FD19_GL001580 [Lacticaseibacillus thailandensis DSM 22698 = JCM 13996]